MDTFKVGDRVRTTGNVNGNNFTGKPTGYEFTVAEIYSSIWHREVRGDSNGVTAENLELVNDHVIVDEVWGIKPYQFDSIHSVRMNRLYSNWLAASTPYYYGLDYGFDYIKPKKTLMNKVSTMMKKLLDADTQTLVKAGYLNGDLDLTDKGKTALNTIVFMANKADLVVSAQEAIDEEETAK